MTAKLFPIFLKLKNKIALVYGNDNHSIQRVYQLLEANAKVRFIYPNLENISFDSHENLLVEERKLIDSDFKSIDIAFVDQSLNDNEFRWLENSSVLYHQLDEMDKTDFYLGSIVDYGPARIAISSNGRFPWLPKFIRQCFEQIFSGDGKEFLEDVANLRDRIKEHFPNSEERHLQIKRLKDHLDIIFRVKNVENKELR